MFKKIKIKENAIFWGIVFSIIPIITFYLMEAYEHNPFIEVRTMAQLFNILLFELLAWILYVITGSFRWSARIELFVAMVFGLVNHYVYLFRTTPFVPWDIFSIGTAASVAGNYDFTPSARIVFVTVVFILIMILVQFADYKMRLKFRFRIIIFAMLTGSLCMFVNLLQDDDFQTRNYLYPFLFTPAYMTQVNGMAVTFAMDLEYVVVDKPAGYNKAEEKEILESYENKKSDDSAEKKPNIIIVMDESFSDLSVLGNFATNEDYMPFIHKLQSGNPNTISGKLNVSVCGGNTANTEFEFLTGNSMSFLPTGSIPYQQYIKGEIPSLASYLKSIGYETYAQHPYYASGWNRDKVYDWMGFDNKTFIDSYSSRNLIRSYISDESSFEQIIKTFEEKKNGEPSFIFNVTMQNHGGYTEQYYNFNNTISAMGKNNFALNQYLSLVKETDSAFEKLIEYFSNVDEDTVIVFFGDHQPSDAVTYSIAQTTENDYNRYQVPYIIWANYDIDSASGIDTSVNYLAANVLKAAGVQTNAYQNYLLQLENEFPVISAVRTIKNDGADEEKIKEYQKLQYYMLFDREAK